MENQKRDTVFSIKLSESENEKFNSLCKEKNLSKPDLLNLLMEQKENQILTEMESFKNTLNEKFNLENMKKMIDLIQEEKINNYEIVLYQLANEIKNEDLSYILTFKKYDLIRTKKLVLFAIKDINYETKELEIVMLPVVKDSKTHLINLVEKPDSIIQLYRYEKEL